MTYSMLITFFLERPITEYTQVYAWSKKYNLGPVPHLHLDLGESSGDERTKVGKCSNEETAELQDCLKKYPLIFEKKFAD